MLIKKLLTIPFSPKTDLQTITLETGLRKKGTVRAVKSSSLVELFFKVFANQKAKGNASKKFSKVTVRPILMVFNTTSSPPKLIIFIYE